MKLKTLKDLPCLDVDHPMFCDKDGGHTYSEDELKAEAIKWHKVRMKEAIPFYHRDWEEFFNITSEDLK